MTTTVGTMMHKRPQAGAGRGKEGVWTASGIELPPPLATPVDLHSGRLGRLLAKHQAFRDVVENGTVLYALQTYTRYDVGWWCYKPCVWALTTLSDLILLAPRAIPGLVDGDAPEPNFFENVLGSSIRTEPLINKTSLRNLHDSRYNHVTGTVVLAPANGLDVDELKMKPVEGYQLLAQIYAGQ